MRKTVFWGQQPVHTSLPFSPFGVLRKPYTNERAKRASLRMGWMGWDGMGWDGVSKVSFNFLYTLCVYRSCIYVLIYILKNCHQYSYGFQNLMSSWGWGNTILKITLCKLIFKYLDPKLSFFFLFFVCIKGIILISTVFI